MITRRKNPDQFSDIVQFNKASPWSDCGSTTRPRRFTAKSPKPTAASASEAAKNAEILDNFLRIFDNVDTG